MAFTIGKYGIDSLANLAGLVATFYLTSLLFVLLVLGTVARLCGFSILKLIRYLKAELLLVLGTSSSESALPSLMEKMERAGCAKSVVGLVVPHRLFLQPRRHQHLHDTGGAVHRAGLQRGSFAGRAAHAAAGRGHFLEGRGGRDGRGVHHAGGDPVDRAHRARCGDGADPRRGSLHERVPQPHQFHRQCRGHRGGRAWDRSLDAGALRRALDGSAPAVPARAASEADPD